MNARVQGWFAERGWTPFEFQREAWEAFARGESGLIHAPTGVGKTLAAWLGPVMEGMEEGASAQTDAPAQPRGGARTKRASSDSGGLRVLWLTPLRALAADTVEAMRAPVDDLGLGWRVEARTGDTSWAAKKRQRENLPAAMVTTPESLSLLLTHADMADKVASVRGVVVDEWHELMSTKRGVQTELCLSRLRALSPRMRVWGLSATLGNLDEALAALMGVRADGSARPGRLIHAPLPKQTRIDTLIPPDIERFPWSGHLGVKMVEDVLREVERAGATLLFTNTRSQAELWFQAILRARPDLTGQVALHHGSLDRSVRGRVETLLREGRLKCVVCTSSLDLGVDFSPVDLVVQIGSPKGVARLLQRAGRSGHRPGAVSRIVCAPTHAFELVEFSAAREAAAARDVEERRPLDAPLDVLAQHLVTLALGGGFVAAEALAEARSTRAYRSLTDEHWAWVLDFVTRGGPALRAYDRYAKVVERDGRLIVESRPIAALHRMSVGTISSDASMSVRYLSGRTLGTIEEGFIARLRIGDRFVFGGKSLELIRVRDMTAFVRAIRGKKGGSGGVVPRWMGARFPMSTQLAQAVRHRLQQARDGMYADEEMERARPLLEIQARWSRVPAADELLMEHVSTPDGHLVSMFAFEGRLAHEGLGALLAHRLTRRAPRTVTVLANDYGLQLVSPSPFERDKASWREALSAEALMEDLLEALNATELARRQFREIARVAGLVFPGYPGMAKSNRQLQASSELFFDVFTEFDPGNLLLEQSKREVLDRELEAARLGAALQRIARSRLVIVETPRLTPMAFPLWAEFVRSQATSESWVNRVQRMAVRLEEEASGRASGPPPRRRGAVKERKGRRAKDRVAG